MIYAILTVLGAIAAWVYHLLNQNSKLKVKVAEESAKNMIKEWADQLHGKIQEDERDYEKAKSEFNNKHGSDPLSPGDTK